MDNKRKSCCAYAVGWSLVGIAIAFSWGVGNLSTGMSSLSAFTIPGLIVLAIFGVLVLSVLEVPWFQKFCACNGSESEQKDDSHIDLKARLPQNNN